MQYSSTMAGQDGALSQRVFEELESRIIARVYPPGMHLVEDDVAADLGVSRTPVREAFRLLQRAGWLELRPHVGAYVRAATVDEVREIFELRQTLEARAAQLAAQRSVPDEHQQLRALLDEGRRAVNDRRWERVAALNTEFHATIAAMARNALLHRILKDLSKQVAWHFSAVAGLRGSDSWNEHEQLVMAIAKGDDAAADAVATEHSRRTRDAFVESLFELGDLRIG
jgi:DNA-binding GntR family transcriptional regulator